MRRHSPRPKNTSGLLGGRKHGGQPRSWIAFKSTIKPSLSPVCRMG
jgi:hypothetical protein